MQRSPLDRRGEGDFSGAFQGNGKGHILGAGIADIDRKAPGKGGVKARLITPDDIGSESRGKGFNKRHVHNILPETEPADSLLVVEVITPSGCWSSYPPHKHVSDNLPEDLQKTEGVKPGSK